MTGRINQGFTDEDFMALKTKKDAMRNRLKLKNLVWEDFILIAAGIQTKPKKRN